MLKSERREPRVEKTEEFKATEQVLLQSERERERERKKKFCVLQSLKKDQSVNRCVVSLLTYITSAKGPSVKVFEGKINRFLRVPS